MTERVSYDAEITDLGIAGYHLRKPVPVRIYTLPGAHDPWIVDDQVRMKASEHGLDEREAVVRWCWGACWLHTALESKEPLRSEGQRQCLAVLREYIRRDADAPEVPEFSGLCKCQPQWRLLRERG